MTSKADRAKRPPRVPSYCLHRATEQAYIKAGGKVTYLGVYGSDASRAVYASAVAAVLSGRDVAVATRAAEPTGDGLTVREVCRRFTAHAEGYYRKNGEPTSEFLIVAAACRRAIELAGDLPADRFGPLALKSVRAKRSNAAVPTADAATVAGHLDTKASRGELGSHGAAMAIHLRNPVPRQTHSMPVNLVDATSAFGAAVKKRLANPAVRGEPEGQLRGPFETR